MSFGFLTRDAVRGFDRRAIENLGVPSLVLMENAGRGAAELLISLALHGPVLICCGKGNNGGDGLVIARHLLLHGVRTTIRVLAKPEELSSDARVNYDILERSEVPMTTGDAAMTNLLHECNRAEWVVDALFGTGLTGPVREPFGAAIEIINRSTAKVLAVDIPSGLDCDTGNPLGSTIRAAHTATFVAPKIGFANPESEKWTGKVHVIPIGVALEQTCAR